MLIPQHKIEEIVARADLMAIVGRHVQLKKSGREFKGCCPFHNEKTPSFYVYPERHFYKCYGCNEHGDTIKFLQKLGGKSFIEAVRELAREVGVDLGAAEDPLAVERLRLRQVNEVATQHFAANLQHPATGRIAREHLQARSVNADSIARFGLGYAPDAWTDLADRLTRDGTLDDAIKAGLLNPSNKGKGPYDVFRGRLMIPIRSPEGRTLGFGARLLVGESPAKYLNTRDSPLYTKGEVLFGLDQARESIRRSGVAVLVEGYFDVIGLYQAGITNAVALSSTSISAKQLDLLARQGAKELVLLLDGDVAGVKAVERLALPILGAGVTAKVAALPEGQDPDDYAVKNGLEATKKLIAGAKPLTQHLLDQALPDGAKATWEAKVAALKGLEPLFKGIPPGLQRTLLVQSAAQHLGVKEQDISRAAGPGAPPPTPAAPTIAAPPASARPASAAIRHEEFFVALMLADPTLWQSPGAEAVDQLQQASLRAVLEQVKAGEDLGELWGSLEAGLAKRLMRMRGEILANWPKPESRRDSLIDTARSIRLMQVEDQIKRVVGELQALGGQDHDNEDVRSLLEEQQALRQERTRLTAPRDEPSAIVQPIRPG